MGPVSLRTAAGGAGPLRNRDGQRLALRSRKAFAAYQRARNEEGGPIDPEDYLGAAESEAERSNLYALAAIQRPGYALDLLRESYRLDPTNPVVELLLVREMSKLEDWLMTRELTFFEASMSSSKLPDYYDYDDHEEYERAAEKVRRENYRRDRIHLKQLRRFLDDYRGGNERLTSVLRAQAALLDEDYRAALAALPTGPAPDDAFGQQEALVRFLATVQLPDLAADKRHQEIAYHLERLEAPYEEYDNRRAIPARLASQVYEQAGDTVTAFLLYNRSVGLPAGEGWASDYFSRIDYLDRTMSDALMNRIIRVVAGKPENIAQQKLLEDAEEYLPSVDALHDLAGTLALRRNDLATARAHFAAVSPTHYADGYFSNLYESPLSDVVGTPIRFTSKAATVGQMQALEGVAGTGGDAAAAACLTLATAWYNMSDFGPAWNMLRYGKSAYEPEDALPWPHSGGHRATPHSSRDYALMYRASRSLEYLDCAEASVEDEELAARIAFLRGLLNRDREIAELDIPYDYNHPNAYDNAVAAIRREAFQPFLRAYRQSEYYDEVGSKCTALGWND